MSVLPTVYLVDDDAAVLRAVSRLLGAAGYRVAAYSSPVEFLGAHDPSLPGCAVLDMAMPGLDGLAVQRALGHGAMERQIVFVTGQVDVPTSVRAMRGGAVDLLTKPVSAEDLCNSVALAVERDRVARDSANRRRVIQDRLDQLTRREREVLGFVVAGRLNKQIAAQLGIAEKTIKVHRGRVMEKMGVRSVAELVRAVERNGQGTEELAS